MKCCNILLSAIATGRAVQVTGTTPSRMADGRTAEEATCATRTGR